MAEIRFGQKITEIPNEDGSTSIVTEGYFEGPKTHKEQTREDIQTSTNSLLGDVIKCLDVLKGDTSELTILIKKDKYGSPNLIQRTWVVEKRRIN